MERAPKLIAGIVIIVISVIVLGAYGYLQFREYLRGPGLLLTEPENGAAFASPLIAIAGRAENAAFLTLNGKQIFTDEQGDFREKLLLQEGYNILAIDARDRFGRTARKIVGVVYKSASSSPPAQGGMPSPRGGVVGEEIQSQ